jgi:hypothetical protein
VPAPRLQPLLRLWTEIADEQITPREFYHCLHQCLTQS